MPTNHQQCRAALLRVGLAIRPHAASRMRELCKRFDISQGALYEALVLGMSDEEIDQVIKRVDGKLIATRTSRRDQRKRLLDRVRNLTLEELENLMLKIESRISAQTAVP